MSIKSKCRHCRAGHKPGSDGYHFIVKSIRPARINIVLCADYVKPDDGKPLAPGGMLDGEATP